MSRGAGPRDLPTQVRHQQADLADPANLKPAFDGAEALFLLVTGNLSAGDVTGVLDTARAAGLSRVVFLSSQGVGTRRHPPELENAVKQSGLEWTMLRPGGFGSNALMWSGMVREQRMVAAPFGDVALPVVDPADIADVAAAALRGTGHVGNTYELTGPARISPREQVAVISDVLGEPVQFVEQGREEARAGLLQFMPEPVAETTLDILGTPSPAEQRVSPDVERVLGRPPRAFAEWAARNAAAFR
ncbi:NAD(P)H-binding protein [Saccharopolyspora taberi]|uniref:NAD(P)H-binding protein n=1 Tax=Saccharopolyspora taberi TaxID=60895 RepID=A0ABN3VMK1_9PSEU